MDPALDSVFPTPTCKMGIINNLPSHGYCEAEGHKALGVWKVLHKRLTHSVLSTVLPFLSDSFFIKVLAISTCLGKKICSPYLVIPGGCHIGSSFTHKWVILRAVLERNGEIRGAQGYLGQDHNPEGT